jgi:hypothetical protein
MVEIPEARDVLPHVTVMLDVLFVTRSENDPTEDEEFAVSTTGEFAEVGM